MTTRFDTNNGIAIFQRKSRLTYHRKLQTTTGLAYFY
jgi:hypothetical protein